MSEKKRIPEIRFNGFEDEWEEKRLGDFGDVLSCKRIYKNETTEADEIPFYKIGSFGNIADSFISREIFLEYKEKYSYPKIGQVLISASGTLGRTVTYNGEEAYFQDSNIVWLDNDTDKLTNKFLYNFYQKTTWNTTEGSTIKRLYNKDIISKRIILPKVKEQNKISNILNNLNEVINKCDYLIQKNIELKQSMLQKMFPKEGEKVPEMRFEGFEGEWEETALENTILTEKKGFNKLDDLSIGEFEYLDTDRLNGGRSFLCNGIPNVDVDDILILWDGSKAGTIYSGFYGVLATTLKSYKIKESFDSKYIYHYLKMNEKNIMHNYRTPNIPHVVKDFTKIFCIKHPTLEEQRLIGLLFHSLDKQITLEQQKLTTYRSLKRTLLNKLFV